MPLLSPLDIVSKPPQLDEPEDAPKRTLLIVDDEEGPRQSLKIILKDEYNLLIAETGERAVELAREQAVDAAIIDIRMSGMSGIDLLGHLKQTDSGIEVIMLTAYETVDTARQALRLGACDYLTKPFDISTIRAAVARAMERHSLTDEIRSNNQKLLALQSELTSKKLDEEITRNRGEIYASIIHDINGPLTVISGLIAVINTRMEEKQVLEGEDFDTVRDRLARITRQVTRCIEISHRYLSFLKQRNEGHPIVSVNQVLADLNDLLRPHPALANHQLVVELFKEDIRAEINGTDLLQILLNLAINAFQSTRNQHRVEIYGAPLFQPLNMSRLVDGPHERLLNREGFANAQYLVALMVKDDGPGIPPEVLDKMFQPFFTTKTGSQGTGLGLSIVNRLLKESRSGLHVRTQPGSGTTFTVFIPCEDPLRSRP